MTDEQWEVIKPLLPLDRNGPGRPIELDMRQTVDAMFYINRTGCQWENMPKDYPNHNSVYYHYRKWCTGGIWKLINTALRKLDRQKRGRNPDLSASIINTQSTKTTEAGGEPSFDVFKRINGRKRHIVVDTIGNLLEVAVHAAGIQVYHGARSVLQAMIEAVSTRKKIWADAIYRNSGLVEWVQETLEITLDIVEREPGKSVSKFFLAAG
jgi:putative transposase